MPRPYQREPTAPNFRVLPAKILNLPDEPDPEEEGGPRGNNAMDDRTEPLDPLSLFLTHLGEILILLRGHIS